MREQIRELIETTILTLSIFAVLQFSIQNYLVQGPSMVPTLNEGERLFVNKLIYKRLNLHVVCICHSSFQKLFNKFNI